MPRAISLSYDVGDPDDDTGTIETIDDTGDLMESLMGGGAKLLSSLLGGGGKGFGESIGSLAGAGLGTLAGGAGTAIGANLGKMAGGAVENLVRRKPKTNKPAPKP